MEVLPVCPFRFQGEPWSPSQGATLPLQGATLPSQGATLPCAFVVFALALLTPADSVVLSPDRNTTVAESSKQDVCGHRSVLVA